MNNLAYNVDSFDRSKFKSMIANKNSRFVVDLSGMNLSQVLSAYEEHHKKRNQRYRIGNVIYNIKRLEEYIDETIEPINVTDEFYLDFRQFLLSVPNENGKTLANSTINTYFDTIGSALSWASKHGAEISESFHDYSKPSYESAKVALTPSQIAHLYYFDINNAENQSKIRKTFDEFNYYQFSFDLIKRIRDTFVLGCNLGQRFSDYSRITRDNFDDSGTVFRCTQQKTGQKAVVNIARDTIDKRITFEILRNYDYCTPAYRTSNANANKILHTLFKVIGGEFDKNYVSENKVNGEVVRVTKKMWQIVTTHTARRTFITYWTENQMPLMRLQRCTGHKDARHLSRYVIFED